MQNVFKLIISETNQRANATYNGLSVEKNENENETKEKLVECWVTGANNG